MIEFKEGDILTFSDSGLSYVNSSGIRDGHYPSEHRVVKYPLEGFTCHPGLVGKLVYPHLDNYHGFEVNKESQYFKLMTPSFEVEDI